MLVPYIQAAETLFTFHVNTLYKLLRHSYINAMRNLSNGVYIKVVVVIYFVL
jgi:hypothetical protein